MMKLIRAILDPWLLWALFSAALMLAIAHAFETFGGLAPCTLCLKQREVYWVAGTVALVGSVVVRLSGFARWRWAFEAALTVIFAVGLFYAIYHAGAEWKFWPGPTTCSGGGAKVDISTLAAVASGTVRVKPPACDQAAWVFLGLSMAGWNALISLKLMVYSAWATVRHRASATA
jgi:disulfide bond formation protein DsbB